ncbi:SRPBCC family protein [Noviherbaspirillum sp.]|uniref:SRPBCC family protein n=1 Tax=Noviherbaspirillum sp. TaxID=1926288 RepID=UPI002B460BBA|nr:SRPBCC family protein [Noviherbaspirillum sp.]HJV80372.1 SRPBCC family protein [Noviherbaspirillum sp.]
MKFRALLQFSVLGMGVLAHGIAASATLLDVRESIAIAAVPEVVWKAVKDFDDMRWHPAVAATRLTAGRNNEPQAIRLLTLKDGAGMTEQLRVHDDARRVQHYTMLESPLPVTDYDASLAVTPMEGGTSLVTWQARFRRKEDAPVDDDTVKKTISGIFAAGLGNLKQLLETTR